MNKELIKNQTYIGDGVYAGIDELNQVVIWTERREGTHWMGLGYKELLALQKYIEDFSTLSS